MISPDDSIFCRIYTGRTTNKDVASLLSLHFSFEPRGRFMKVGNHEIEVRRSDEKWSEDEQDEFTKWPVHVELAGDPDEPADFVDLTATVLRLLWGQGFPSVAACDFEDELPWAGGIRHPEIPPQGF